MIKVDDMAPVPPVARRGHPTPLAADTGDLAATSPDGADERPPERDELFFVSPPPVPFPRILPGL